MRVVIAPESATTTAIRDCLVSWSRVGLLGPFCLWAVPLQKPAGVADAVERIEDGAVATGSLAEVLQGIPSDQVTLVGLYAAGPEGFDAAFAERVGDCLTIGTEVLAFEKGHPIECTVMVVPETIGQPVPLDVFCGTWNLYVAPEDRASPAEANLLSSSKGLLPRHAAHALATVADLWANAAVQPSDALTASAGREAFSIDPPAVRVVRTFTRVIDLGYLADHIAAGVFRAGKAWPNPDPNRFDRAGEPSRLIAEAKREFIDVHGELIGLTEFKPLELPPERRPNLWDALLELIQMIRARIRRLPVDLADATVGKAHDYLAGVIDRYRGSDAAKTMRWRERPEGERRLDDLAAELDHALYTPDGATAAVWHDLRQLALGLIDGAPLPNSIEPKLHVRGDKRLLVTNPEAVVPDPEAQPPVPGLERPCDPLNLDPRFAEREGEENDGSISEVELERRQKLEEWVTKLRPTLLWAVGAEIAAALETAKAAAAELDHPGASAETETERVAEKSDAKPAQEEEAGGAEEQPSVQTGRRRRWRALRNRFLVYGLAAVGISAIAWSNLAFLPAAGAQLAIVAAWAVAMGTLALRFVRTEREIMRKEIQAQFEIVNRATRRAFYAGDLPRLQRRYAEYLDWAEIIGWMAHHPWVGEPIGRVEVKAPVRQGTLPSAFRVAAGVVPPENIEALCNQARSKVLDSGWLTEQYRVSLEQNNRRVSLTRSYSGAGGSLDPDADVDEEPDSPRRLLREAIRRGEGRHLRDNEMTGEVLRFVSSLSLDAAAKDVVTSLSLRSREDEADEQLDALPPCPAWFAPPRRMFELSARIQAAVVSIAAHGLVGPQVGLGVPLGAANQVVTSFRVVADATTIRVQLPDGSSHQASLLRAFPGHDLALLELDGAVEGLQGELQLAEEKPQLGEPVLAPAPPDRDPGQPEVALGLLVKAAAATAEGDGSEARFGVAYRTLAGPAGSPVFDLQGRLLGIHRAVDELERPGETASLSRPVTAAPALRALLDGEEEPAAREEQASGRRPPAFRDRVQRPSLFFESLFVSGRESMGLLPQHWKDADEQHMPELVLGHGEFGYETLDRLCSAAEFLQPVRAIVHRVDISAAIAAKELVSGALNQESPVL